MRICPICRRPETESPFYSKAAGKCKICQRLYMIEYRQREKLLAFKAYCGDKIKCSCPGCEEDRIPFLVIDHANGGGRAHLKSLAGKNETPGGGVLHRWLRQNGYPVGYRVLCHNCNTSRGKGPCPVHEIEQLIALTATKDVAPTQRLMPLSTKETTDTPVDVVRKSLNPRPRLGRIRPQ